MEKMVKIEGSIKNPSKPLTLAQLKKLGEKKTSAKKPSQKKKKK